MNMLWRMARILTVAYGCAMVLSVGIARGQGISRNIRIAEGESRWVPFYFMQSLPVDGAADFFMATVDCFNYGTGRASFSPPYLSFPLGDRLPVWLWLTGEAASLPDEDIELRITTTYSGKTVGSGTITVTTTIPPPVIPKVELEELTFSDNTGFTADNGAWIGTGNQKWTPTYKTSALFTQKDHKAKINAKLKIPPQLSSAMSMTIQGTADNGVTFTKTFDLPASTTSYTVNDIEASTAYDANFDYIGQVDWKITYSGDDQDLPNTDNNIYYVPEGVQGTLHKDTILYVVCRNMDGKPYGGAGALNAIWGELSDLQVRCADRSTVLRYWKEDADESRASTDILLKDRSGNCQAWSRFCRDCLKLSGKTAGVDIRRFQPGDGGEALWVRNLSFLMPQNYGHGEYQYKHNVDVGLGTPIGAQGGAPCSQRFTVHIFVKIDGGYYDPSYGKQSANASDAEDAVLDATSKVFSDGTFFRKNNTTSQFLEEHDEAD